MTREQLLAWIWDDEEEPYGPRKRPWPTPPPGVLYLFAVHPPA